MGKPAWRDLGLAVGIGLGLALTNALHDAGIDHVAIPGGNLISYALVAGVVGVVAAIFPAIRAARLDVLQAIATE